MWFSIGAHPGFACPVRRGERFEDYELSFELEETADRMLLDGGLIALGREPLLRASRTLPLSSQIFERGALVCQGLRSRWVALQRRGGADRLTVRVEGSPYLGIWTKPGAPFLCIEPWHGIADRAGSSGSLEEKEGILRLEKGETFRCGFAIEVEEI